MLPPPATRSANTPTQHSAAARWNRRLASLLLSGLSSVLLLAAASAVRADGPPGPGVAWQAAASDADISRVFDAARQARKPLLLYWGASWCPPCNQLKATLFNRQDFINRAQGFVAVHIDGDGPGAQQLGGRFKVRGYPTLILMQADGSEITRLPGEVDAPQVMALLQQGLAGGRPVKAVLAQAQAGRPVSAAEWRLLAWYGWDTDEAQLVPQGERANLLAELSRRCGRTEPQAATRLLLKAVAESDDGQGIKPDAALRQRVRAVLSNASASRLHMDVLVNQGHALARALAPEPGADREVVVQALNSALRRLQADASLSKADRLSALLARVELARLDQPRDALQPKLAPPLLAEVRALSARMDQTLPAGHERQAVVSAAAHLLGRAGLWADSDALLTASLAKSQQSYYLMSQLGSNARKQGRNDDALRWFAQAHASSTGPATRLQWGASHVNALVDLAPQDAARIEAAVNTLIQDAAQDPAAFHERSARSLQRVAAKLARWNTQGQHDTVLRRLQAQLAPVCLKLDATDPQRARCDGLLKGALHQPA